MAKNRRKMKRSIYLIGETEKLKFCSLEQIADYLHCSWGQVQYAFSNKKIIRGYIISDHTNIRRSAYKPIIQKHYEDNKIKVGNNQWISRNKFYEESEKFNNIERQWIGFDSISGINEKKVEQFKPTWILTEEQAEQQQLQLIFNGGSLYIDKGKRIFKKDGDRYYQLTLPQIIIYH